ncbi:diguanylate cyclase domain-containing protein [Geobacter sp. AOG2]|uniref:sensor domain-containing diguanylate cyclase n=1 Tax=Geobacter sp. AOG2 TaxID=1566347 RepID=UPI001CC3BCDA|nr:diguanylate cyclase [Geobacter sp. AOG2]GFE59850.1 diguanylate cyclase [Geobacter sp. AOG2]
MSPLNLHNDISLLFVEDDETARDTVSRLLMRVVGTVYVAADGREGLETYKVHTPDVVVTDIRMPVMDGIEMVREIRRLRPDCQVVILTAFSDIEYLLDCVSLGINHYIRKPIDFARLAEAIDKCCDYIDLKRRLRKQDETLNLLSQAMEQAPASVLITDLQGAIEYVNTTFTKVTGYSTQEIIGKNPRILKSDLNPPELYRELWNSIREGKEWECELANRRKDGQVYWELAKFCPLRNSAGAIIKYLKVSQDITERKHYEENLRYLSNHDSLTNLYNRAYFEAEMSRLAASRDFPVSIVIADIDGLKLINDNYGHDEGDRLIRMAAELLLSAFRAGDVVSRIGGDEFAVLLPRTDQETAQEAVQRIIQGDCRPKKEKNGYARGLSLGVATAYDASGLHAALKLADRRMYLDKYDKKGHAPPQHLPEDDGMAGD